MAAVAGREGESVTPKMKMMTRNTFISIWRMWLLNIKSCASRLYQFC